MSLQRQNEVLRDWFLGRKDGAGGWEVEPAWTHCPVTTPNGPWEIADPPSFNRIAPWTELEVRGGEDPEDPEAYVEGVGWIYWRIQEEGGEQILPGITGAGTAKWRDTSRLFFVVQVPEETGEAVIEEYMGELKELWSGWEFHEAAPKLYLYTDPRSGPRSSGTANENGWWGGLVEVVLHRETMRMIQGLVAV